MTNDYCYVNLKEVHFARSIFFSCNFAANIGCYNDNSNNITEEEEEE